MCSAFCRPRNARRRMRRSEARTNFDSRGISATSHGNRAGLAFAVSPMDRLPARPNRAASCSHRGPCRHRAGLLGASLGAPARRVSSVERRKARRATVMPLAQTFEAPHGRFQERHNYATAIAREKPIGASQTRDLRGRRRSNGWHAGWLVLGERIRTSKALYSTRHTSGGVASPARSFRAKSRSIWVCSGEPSLRTETVRSAASFLPTTKRTGTLASKCSRTL